LREEAMEALQQFHLSIGADSWFTRLAHIPDSRKFRMRLNIIDRPSIHSIVEGLIEMNAIGIAKLDVFCCTVITIVHIKRVETIIAIPAFDNQGDIDCLFGTEFAGRGHCYHSLHRM
jgi:hypothetical protein